IYQEDILPRKIEREKEKAQLAKEKQERREKERQEREERLASPMQQMQIAEQLELLKKGLKKDS
ncbi:3984_t:CDS:1, partial [Acaulospora colombiana]